MKSFSENRLVSVVISCYNYGDYLRLALKSVLAQTYSNVEVIVVNDGSTDNTEEVAKSFENKLRLTYIPQVNQGHAHAKNTGIRNAHGDFVAFLDADDLWAPDKLSKQLACFNKPEVGVVYCRMKFIGPQGEDRFVDLGTRHLDPRRGQVSEALFFDNFVPFSSAVVRKEVFSKIGLMDENVKMGNDWDFWLRASVDFEFDYVDEELLLYRIGHAGQMSKNQEERQRCSDLIMSKFLKTHPGVVSLSSLKSALVYTYTNRALYYRDRDLKRSTSFLLSAIKTRPGHLFLYKGLARNFLNWLSRRGQTQHASSLRP